MRELSKREVIFIVIIVLFLAAAGVFAWKTGRDKKGNINSFADCVAAGYPVMESYPEQCAADGKSFVNPDQQALTPDGPNNVQEGIVTFVDDTVFDKKLRDEITSNIVEPLVDFNQITDEGKVTISKSDDGVYPYELEYFANVNEDSSGGFLFGEEDGSAGYWYPENCDPFNDSECRDNLDQFNQKYPDNYQNYRSKTDI